MKRLALALLAAGGVLLAGAPAAWVATRPDVDAGSLAELGAAAPAAVAGPHFARDGLRERLGRVRPAVGPQPATRSARLADLEQRRARRPVEVQIPALRVRAAVIPAGVERNGELELPKTGKRAAWYRWGAEPGRQGTALLAAHVDYDERPGIFFRLRTLEPGSRVIVRLKGNVVRRFRVVARRSYRKERLPDRLFAQRGKPALALITCGGEYDEATRSYERNVVVWAVPER